MLNLKLELDTSLGWPVGMTLSFNNLPGLMWMVSTLKESSVDTISVSMNVQASSVNGLEVS